mmetsp:Transcript_25492/g.83931  ORF Transcript_25492/g.83931 Transcript_25492/m.83931 type:complete len:243 (+) Transcript_25492:631-1359(+)
MDATSRVMACSSSRLSLTRFVTKRGSVGSDARPVLSASRRTCVTREKSSLSDDESIRVETTGYADFDTSPMQIPRRSLSPRSGCAASQGSSRNRNSCRTRGDRCADDHGSRVHSVFFSVRGVTGAALCTGARARGEAGASFAVAARGSPAADAGGGWGTSSACAVISSIVLGRECKGATPRRGLVAGGRGTDRSAPVRGDDDALNIPVVDGAAGGAAPEGPAKAPRASRGAIEWITISATGP